MGAAIDVQGCVTPLSASEKLSILTGLQYFKTKFGDEVDKMNVERDVISIFTSCLHITVLLYKIF